MCSDPSQRIVWAKLSSRQTNPRVAGDIGQCKEISDWRNEDNAVWIPVIVMGKQYFLHLQSGATGEGSDWSLSRRDPFTLTKKEAHPHQPVHPSVGLLWLWSFWAFVCLIFQSVELHWYSTELGAERRIYLERGMLIQTPDLGSRPGGGGAGLSCQHYLRLKIKNKLKLYFEKLFAQPNVEQSQNLHSRLVGLGPGQKWASNECLQIHSLYECRPGPLVCM